MGVQDLHTFLTGTSVAGGTVPVDLLRRSKNTALKQNRNKKRESLDEQTFTLVVDVECCLDRLYGGYFSDWVSGGQWSRMVQFLSVLHQAVRSGNTELVFFFNGSLESQRMSEWVASQLKARQNVNEVLKHTASKGTPPPKIWWVPPTCLRTALRMAMRHLQMTTVCSMDDHRQEAIAYLRENLLHGLVADDAEYAVFDPPKYFSASHLKLTYKGMVETVEYQIGELAKTLDLPREHLCILAALLGNFLLPEQDLTDFYQNLELDTSKPIPAEVLVRTVANFVKKLPSPTNLDAIAIQVFGSLVDKRCAQLKSSIQYYMNGTKDGFLRYCQPSGSIERQSKAKSEVPVREAAVNGENAADLDTSKFASETQESELESLAAYKEATAAFDMDVVGPAANGENGIGEELQLVNGTGSVNGAATQKESVVSSSSSSSPATSPSRLQSHTKVPSLPPVAPEVVRTSSERHQKGLMSPYITQILTHGEIRLPVLLEDERHREVPSIHLFYRPARQMVYAILFNLHHHKYLAAKNKKEKEADKESKNLSKEKETPEKTEIPEVVIKEWVWSKENQYESPHFVRAEQIGWGVPTIHRLWFGSTIDDKRRRLRAFLTCMQSDTALMLNPLYVPQHLLVLACVLRYIMSAPEHILRERELDAIIVQAVCPELMNVPYLQDLQLGMVTSRGIQLATLLMAGVETALLVNDACGSPVPWLMCCPWLYLDGKLLQHTLVRAVVAKNLRNLCGDRMDLVTKVQQMRLAILEGLNNPFARVPLPAMAPASGVRMNQMNPMMGAGGSGLVGGRGGLMRRPVPSRGGQLEVAGVVVCSWGANYGSRGVARPMPPMGQPRPVPPQVTSVGMKQYRMGGVGNFDNYSRHNQRPSFPVRGPRGPAAGHVRKNLAPKKRNSNSGSGARRILTSKDNIDKKLPQSKGAAVDNEGQSPSASQSNDILTNSVLISSNVEPSPLNGEVKVEVDCIGTPTPHHGQGDGPGSVPVLSGLTAEN